MSDDEAGIGLDAVFLEPPRPPSPEPTSAKYVREKASSCESDPPSPWTEITVSLVGTHPLWGHHLWNAARAFATYLDENTELYRDRQVLELGAGGGLPGIIAAKNGARKVVLTDYPDTQLLNNLRHNVTTNIPAEMHSCVDVQGYIWGQPVKSLYDHLPSQRGFDLIIMSDLIFNHSQHEALLNTCSDALTPSSTDDAIMPAVLVFYTHHRPRLAHRDMVFFRLAQEKGWTCQKILERRYPLMFPEDSGDEEVRSTVHGWSLTRRCANSMP
ncbi:hypothetical protein AMATHDRAFT_39859 [Amanita thiersii Skay4041]|uniref:Protein N-terminal and lysine N-methyltransferase EFM7 n=1 Tax=Amanita thiersii Skay4041 TaxID=703135 RepID=A0A2A9NUJ9_9AGAR|nr:hypothetical protein AMATHDRAFT_39859 [Amanita thiersii Skay4041]